MPYKCPIKQSAALARWREKHPDYMRNYMRAYNVAKTTRRHRNTFPEATAPSCAEAAGAPPVALRADGTVSQGGEVFLTHKNKSDENTKNHSS